MMIKPSELVVGVGMIAVLILGVVLMGNALPDEYPSERKPGRISQASFLKVCNEDEVLMFIAGEFKDAVCVNRDEAGTYILEVK